MADYTLTELMAVSAAREIGDGEIVFAGTGLPMLGAMLAQHTHAPNCCIIFEAGAMASQLEHLPMSVGDPRTLRGAATAAGLSEIFAYTLQSGRVDVGFISGAQIDRYGNINSTSIGADHRHPTVRFPGSGSCATQGTRVANRHGQVLELARHGASLKDDAAVGRVGVLCQHRAEHRQARAGKHDLAVADLAGSGNGHQLRERVVSHQSSLLRGMVGL